jgi:hypothetical protein
MSSFRTACAMLFGGVGQTESWFVLSLLQFTHNNCPRIMFFDGYKLHL